MNDVLSKIDELSKLITALNTELSIVVQNQPAKIREQGREYSARIIKCYRAGFSPEICSDPDLQNKTVFERISSYFSAGRGSRERVDVIWRV